MTAFEIRTMEWNWRMLHRRVIIAEIYCNLGHEMSPIIYVILHLKGARWHLYCTGSSLRIEKGSSEEKWNYKDPI